MPVLGRRAQQRQARRAEVEGRVLTATRRLLAAGESFADLSVERIAAEAGISRPGFYDHFADKRELLVRLIDEGAAPIYAEADELVNRRPSGPESIPFTVRAAVAWARSEPAVFRAAMEASGYDPVVAEHWHRLLDRFVDVLAARIAAQQEAGRALPIDPRAAALSLVGMTTAALHQAISRGLELDDGVLETTLTTIAVRAVYGDAGQP